ncbi:dihydrofolate reductase family protein [Agromyces archimandritae]|uniref:Dihydrofolate reductase family protein n=1 Tax=Agromyces archimandritae TaxID=2781962 RepID=A0A975IMS8_9MICO|nr:dihydrofolate reductase family protein [Agromyces archimandritae]QTX03484.1 dihydrofolate reductase family protein [Agromyces archimandritae]
MRELVYYVAVSLDGFIAGPDGQFDAFLIEGDHMDDQNERFADAIPTAAAAHLGIHQPKTTFDTVLMGWNTYAVGLPAGVTSPYPHLRQIVFTRTHEASGDRLETSGEDPVEVVRRLKAEPGADIWLCGGGALAASLADEIDRLVLKRQPLLFGAGVPLFGPRPFAPELLKPVGTTAYASGVVISEFVRTGHPPVE